MEGWFGSLWCREGRGEGIYISCVQGDECEVVFQIMKIMRKLIVKRTIGRNNTNELIIERIQRLMVTASESWSLTDLTTSSLFSRL